MKQSGKLNQTFKVTTIHGKIFQDEKKCDNICLKRYNTEEFWFDAE